MYILPTTFLKIAVYYFSNRPFLSCLLPLLFQNESLTNTSLIYMKINLQVRLIVIRMVLHKTSLSQRGRENSEMVYFVKDWKK